ncbi:hypothetical protein GGR56DRAFT_616360 [Xylariaceae sp. FL0804]|nr:hypothetical protein GGR56DRAFT_616360 [Xylariaceae sp. FL0804]
MAPFLNLPLELLQLIVGTCPARDILRLSQTCRALRLACLDPVVFQRSFEIYIPDPVSPVLGDKSTLVHILKVYVDGPRRPCRRNEDPGRTWLCLAVAASQLSLATRELERLASSVKLHATLESQQLGRDTRESLQGVIGFLSTVPVWGYTTICNANLAATLDSLCPIFFSRAPALLPLRIDQSLGIEHPIRFTFCLALSGLQADNWNQPNLGSTETGDPRIPLGPGTDALQAVVKAVFEGGRTGPDYASFSFSWIGKQTHALLLAVLITRNLQYVSRDGQPGVLGWILGLTTAGASRRIQIRLPRPEKIEFYSPWYFDNLRDGAGDHAGVQDTKLHPRFPILSPKLSKVRGIPNDRGRCFYPFAGDDWWAWYRARVRDMTQRVDEGEWYGHYTYGISLAGRVDGPMERICFKKTKTSGDVYTIEAKDCSDSIGRFNLSGELNSAGILGSVRLKKTYTETHHSFTWDGLVTPLGMLGRYYHEFVHGLAGASGYFWLWKIEWMDDETL